MAPPEATLTTRDVTVSALRGGAGRTLVFLHGAAGLPPWSPFLEQLAGAHEVIAPEHPGFGTSANPPWIRNVADMAMYYLDVLDGLDAKRVHLVGHSLGGWIAAELAVRNCARLASLTLIAPAGVRVKGVPMGDNFIWSPQETAENLFYDRAFTERMLAQVPDEKEAEIALVNRFAAAKLGWEPRWFNPALERWLHRIQVPTLVLWGENDNFLPCRYAEVWRYRVPETTVELIAQCGHLPHVEKAELTARKILAFVDRH
jgi:pimeloyl-ACP methyl ester carboxylesterase